MLLVLFFHAKVGPFHGGFVGVDVFFVVSGFLITSLLLREQETAGAISLPGFWSRRARRLLSASCLVVVVTLVFGRSMLDPLRFGDLARDALAASLFVINFVLGHRGADYLQSNLPESPLQHFWSLAVEEQFYLVWPLVVFGLSRSREFRRVLGLAVAVLGGASFIACLWYTSHQPARAYYYPWNRVWELLAGAGLAVAGTAVLRIPEQVRSYLAWLGVGGIVFSAVAFDTATAFPGKNALLPVLSTVAVIAAFGTATHNGPVMVLKAKPLQWIGARSYAIYLWHWPALILCEAKWGTLSSAQGALIVAVSIGLAALAYAFVEDPVRRSKWLSADPRRGLMLGASLVAVGSLAAAVAIKLPQDLSGGGTAAAPDLAGGADTTVAGGPGVATTAPGSTTSTTLGPVESLDVLLQRNNELMKDAVSARVVPSNLNPKLADVRKDLPSIYDDGCLLNSGRVTPPDCVFGDPNSATTIFLIGDSHGAQWFPAVEFAAKRRGWRLVVMTKRGCPAAEFKTYGEGGQPRTDCAPWREKVGARLAAEKPDLVIITSYRYRLSTGDDTQEKQDEWRAALGATLGAYRPLTTKMLVLSDTPNPIGDIPSCLSGHLHRVNECIRNRAEADLPGLLTAERNAAKANNAGFVETADWLCGSTVCPVILGNLLLYRDDNHITATASRYFTPFIEAVVAPLLTT